MAEEAPGSWTGRPVLVLCDASETTGLGHFVRCTSLAAVLTRRGADVRLLLAEDATPRAVERGRAAGWPVRLGPWTAEQILPADPTGPLAPVVIVDSYRVSGAWLTDLHARIAAAGGVLAVVDDLADREFTADLVLNQNIGAEELDYRGAGRVLSGPGYALLRPEFPASRAAAMRSVELLPDLPRRVLVLFGGTDTTGMALIGAAAAAAAFPEAAVRVVVPPTAAADAGAEALERVTVLDHVEAIHEEMLAADLVVSAGGTTLWELCCLARPTAVVAVAANQVPTYDRMSAGGYVLPAGREPVRDACALAGTLGDLVSGPGVLAGVARQAATLTDGRGCARVADALAEILDGGPAAAGSRRAG